MKTHISIASITFAQEILIFNSEKRIAKEVAIIKNFMPHFSSCSAVLYSVKRNKIIVFRKNNKIEIRFEKRISV